MKIAWILFALLLAAGLWWFLLRTDDRPPASPPQRDPAEVEQEENPTLTRGREVLTVWGKTPTGIVPPGLEVGYRRLGSSRWLYAEPNGSKVFPDAPIGTYEAAARALGYPEVRQTVVVEAGVPAETVILLRPEKEPVR